MKFECKETSELAFICASILKQYSDIKIFTFKGELGAGKTTMVKEFCKQLDVIDNTNSPTFAIINEYKTSNNNFLYHFDLYRIEKTSELYDLGAEEYLTGNNYCFIEWPELVSEMIPVDYVEIQILWVPKTDKRIITVTSIKRD